LQADIVIALARLDVLVLISSIFKIGAVPVARQTILGRATVEKVSPIKWSPVRTSLRRKSRMMLSVAA